MTENFTKSLLWGFNMYHHNQSLPTYLYHSTQKETKRKVKRVTFREKSRTLCLSELVRLEKQCLTIYSDFSFKFV